MEKFKEGVITPRPEDVEALMAKGFPKEKAEQMIQERLSRANAKLHVERKARLETQQPRYKLDNPRAKQRPSMPPGPKMPEHRPGL